MQRCGSAFPSLDGLRAILNKLPRCPSTFTPAAKPVDRQRPCWCTANRAPTLKNSILRRSFRLYSTNAGQHTHPPHKQHTDLYSVLGVSPKATQQQIKDQFYRLSMLYHPDRNKGSDGAHQRFSEITEAYSILGQHTLRRKYDKGLLQEYPRKPHPDHTHHHRDRHPEATMSAGPKKIYDFDEFYRAHYGEALKWQRERAANRRAADAEAVRQRTLSDPLHRLLLISVVVSVFIAGWMGAKYREHQEKEGKWL